MAVVTIVGPASHVGTYPITASSATDPNYDITIPRELTVQAAALTITANSESMNYGGPVPALTASYSGFLNNDNSSSLTTKPTLTTTATPTSPTGTYPITVSGAVSQLYHHLCKRYDDGRRCDGNHGEQRGMTYGGTIPALTVSYSGFINGDNASA